MPSAEGASAASHPDRDLLSVKSKSGNRGNSGVVTPIYPPSALDTLDSFSTTDRLPSTNLNTKSASNSSRPCLPDRTKSVESLTTLGAYPLGSLRLIGSRRTPERSLDLDIVMENPTDSKPKDAFPTGGDVFILDDLPPNFTVGCDTISFSTKKSFPGFREIPSGVHLIWVAPSELTSSRSAYWIITPEREEWEQSEVYVKQWDKFNEILGEPASHAEERFQREKLKEAFDSLSPYQFRAVASGVHLPPPKHDSQLPSFLANETIWSQLTSAIHPGLLNKITGMSQKSWQVTTLDRVVGDATIAEEARLYATGKPQLRFTFPMNAPLIDPSAHGSERTQQALDPTNFVISTLENRFSDDGHRLNDLIGELSFAFLTGMHLGNFSCLEQWWFLTNRVIFRSFDLVIQRPTFTLNLLHTFHAQLVYNDRYLEGDILDMMPEQSRKLQRSLITYKARLDERLLALGDRISSDQHKAGEAFSALEAWLWRRGWDLRGQYVRAGTLTLEDGEEVEAEMSDFEDEDERGEFAPVVVDLDEGGREAGLVSWEK
ncbi:AAR2 protein-domain-containing protein [Annulohypoxylon moriforme]|nr:AAR2 protein-domain-containing protein [Annulohypoxylon moriforme]